MTLLKVGTPTGRPPLTAELVTVVVIVYWIFLPEVGAQLVRVYPLPATGSAAVQEVTTVGALVTLEQVTESHEFVPLGSTVVHEAAGAGPTASTGQVVVVQLLSAEGTSAVHVPACTNTLPLTTGHVVVVQPLPALAALGVHEATGTLVVLFVAHVVAVHALPSAATDCTQVCTGTLEVSFERQVVFVQLLPALGTDALQVCTATSTVSFWVQVVVFQLFPALATGSATHDETGVGPVLTTGQLVVTQLLPALPGLATQVPLGTFSELFGVQVVTV